MTATTKSDNNTVVRNEAFLENQVQGLIAQVKELQYDCASLTQSNSELSERVKQLASRPPTWPKGYRPQRRQHTNRSN